MLFVPLGELEPLHKERWSGSRLYHVGSCSAQSCLDSLILLFVLSERIRAVTQGDWSIFCTISLILSICRWNKTLNNVMERKKAVSYRIFLYLMIEMLFSRTVNTPFEFELFTWIANICFTAVDKWELLHPVGLVCSTPWNIQWARGDWVAVHRSSKLIGQVGHDKFRRSLSLGITLNFSIERDHPWKGST